LKQLLATAKEYIRTGKYKELLILLCPIGNEGKLARLQASLEGLYYYAEAAFLDENFKIAMGAMERFETALNSLEDQGNTGKDMKDIKAMGIVLNGASALYGPLEGREQGLRNLNRALAYGGIKPVWDVRIKYWLILADYQDYNVIDASRKLSELCPEEEALFSKPIEVLRRKVEERAKLDFRSLRSKRQAFVEIGDHDSWINQLCLNAEGTLVAVIYRDGALKVFHTETGKEAVTFSDNQVLYEEEKADEAGLAFSPDSRYLAVGLGVGLVKIYDLLEEKLHATLNCPGLDWEQLEDNAYYHEYTHVMFSTTGRYLIIVPTAASYDPQGDDGYPVPEPYRTFYCIDFNSGRTVLQHVFDDDSKIAAVAMSPDERLLAVGVFGKRVKVWDVESGVGSYEDEEFVWLGLPSRVGMTETIAFSHDSQTLLYAVRQAVRIVDMADNKHIEDIQLLERYVCCALHVDSQDHVVIARYRHNSPSIIVKYKIRNKEEAVLFSQERGDVDSIWIDEERGEMWVYTSPVLQVRAYANGELIKEYSPYRWSYSPYVISNSVSFSPKSGLAAISFETKIRLV
jgi:WD40 repeat protein